MFEEFINQNKELIAVMNGGAPRRVALWFGVSCGGGVLAEERPSDCLTCPGDDWGDVFCGPEDGLTSSGAVWRNDIGNRGRMPESGGKRGRWCSWCRIEHFGRRFAFNLDVGFTKSWPQLVKSRRSNSRSVCSKNSRVRHVEARHSNSVPGNQ